VILAAAETTEIVATVLALCSAASNALSSVLQRRAAREAAPGDSFRLPVVLSLVRDPAWLAGIGALIAGFLFQAAALAFGGLALVQPILVTELPFTMAFIAVFLGGRPDRDQWAATGAITVGLAVLLVAAAPGQDGGPPGGTGWAIAIPVTAGLVVGLVLWSWLVRGERSAILLGAASGLGFSFTAALMKEVTRDFPEGPAGVVTSWALYGMVAAGLASLLLLQDALRKGPLVAVQPTLNVIDPVSGIAYGVTLFGETIRLGAWLLPEMLGVGLIVYGSVRLSRTETLHSVKGRGS
jgi:drug/metabolite transporter (DMT)-like permease